MSKSTKIIAALGVVAGLGVAAMPLSSYAATEKTATQNLSMIIDETLEIASGGDVEIAKIADNTKEGATTLGEGTVNVKTNSKGGYTLGIAGTGSADRKFASVTTWQTALVNEYGDTIEAKAGALSKDASGWGFRIKAAEGQHNTVTAEAADAFKAVTTNPTTFATENQASDKTGNTYTIEYGVAAQSDQEAGTYKGGVTYTATTKAGTALTVSAE